MVYHSQPVYTGNREKNRKQRKAPNFLWAIACVAAIMVIKITL